MALTLEPIFLNLPSPDMAGKEKDQIYTFFFPSYLQIRNSWSVNLSSLCKLFLVMVVEGKIIERRMLFS